MIGISDPNGAAHQAEGIHDPDPDSLSGKTLLNPQGTGHSTHDNPGQTNDKA